MDMKHLQVSLKHLHELHQVHPQTQTSVKFCNNRPRDVFDLGTFTFADTDTDNRVRFR